MRGAVVAGGGRASHRRETENVSIAAGAQLATPNAQTLHKSTPCTQTSYFQNFDGAYFAPAALGSLTQGQDHSADLATLNEDADANPWAQRIDGAADTDANPRPEFRSYLQ